MSTPIEQALEACRQQIKPNFPAIAAEFNIDRTTLSRRFRGVQRSYAESRSESIQNLNNAQEEVLIDFINRFIDRSMPPTSQVVRNMAEELCGKSVDKN